jgi:hypothetical protein
MSFVTRMLATVALRQLQIGSTSLLVCALLCAPTASSQVRLLKSEADIGGFARQQPPGLGEPPGTVVCSVDSPPIAPDSLSASDAVSCTAGSNTLSGEFLLDIDDSQGNPTEILASVATACATEPLLPQLFGANSLAKCGAQVLVDFEVETPVQASFTVNGAGNASGQGTINTASARLSCSSGCDTTFSECFASLVCPEPTFPQSVLLQPGTYRLEVFVQVQADSSTGFGLAVPSSASASASLLIQFESQAECDLTWSESGAGGAFDEDVNWSPQQTPQDDGDGCNDLLLDRPGAYAITYGAGAAADSISVLQGAPTLQGGSLALAGFDDTALSVGGNASLNIAGTLTADDVHLNGQSFLSNSGQLTLDVLGDLSLAPLPDSDVAMLLAAIGDDPAGDTVNLKVGGNWNVGDAGGTAATLQGRTTGTASNVRLGVQDAGVGILNVVEAASLDVTDELRIGVAGTGTLNVNTQGQVSADTVLVSGASGGAPSLLSVGAGASLTVTTTLEAGRAAEESGEIRLGELGSESTTLVSVVGDMTLAGAGEALLSGEGPLQLDVLGDFSMAVFPDSSSGLVLGVVSDEPSDDGELRDAAKLTVNGTWTVGGAGEAAATLADQTNATVNSLRIGQLEQGGGLLNVIEGATLEVTEGASVGGTGVGTLNISNVGSFLAENVTVDGAADEDISTLRLSGESNSVPAAADIAFNLVVGNTTSGLWNMEGGAQLDAGIITLGSLVGSSGSATLFGSSDIAGNTLLTVKVSAAESMFIGLDGSGSYASADSADQRFGELSIGVNQGANGSYFASGALNFTTIEEDLIVGGAGSGDLELRAGGVTAAACILGAQNGGFGAVRVLNGGALVLGTAGSVEGEAEGEGKRAGKTSISFPGFLEIGRKANGIIELFDAGTRLACDEIIIGGDNSAAGGTLNVDTGATVECGASLTLGANAGPGLVRVADGATMNVGSLLIIAPEGLFIAGGGASITSGSVVVNGLLRVVNGLRIDRPDGKNDSIEQAKGGDGPTVIDGALEVGANGTLEVVAGAGEALVVTGSATLAGTLEINLLPGGTFTDNQLLELIDFQGGVTGSFANLTFPNAPDGFVGDVEFEDGALRLRVIRGGTVDPEGEDEGEGEGDDEPVVPGGCQGCNASGGSVDKVIGDWLALFLGFAVMLGAHLRFQRVGSRVA